MFLLLLLLILVTDLFVIENNWLNCVLVYIPFVSFCRFYKGAVVLEDCARRNDLLS